MGIMKQESGMWFCHSYNNCMQWSNTICVAKVASIKISAWKIDSNPWHTCYVANTGNYFLQTTKNQPHRSNVCYFKWYV